MGRQLKFDNQRKRIDLRQLNVNGAVDLLTQCLCNESVMVYAFDYQLWPCLVIQGGGQQSHANTQENNQCNGNCVLNKPDIGQLTNTNQLTRFEGSNW